MLIYDKEYETKENKKWTNDKIKLQHTRQLKREWNKLNKNRRWKCQK